jgi:hypothetical protein
MTLLQLSLGCPHCGAALAVNPLEAPYVLKYRSRGVVKGLYFPTERDAENRGLRMVEEGRDMPLSVCKLRVSEVFNFTPRVKSIVGKGYDELEENSYDQIPNDPDGEIE